MPSQEWAIRPTTLELDCIFAHSALVPHSHDNECSSPPFYLYHCTHSKDPYVTIGVCNVAMSVRVRVHAHVAVNAYVAVIAYANA